jgi:putative ABC transport system permease protein
VATVFLLLSIAVQLTYGNCEESLNILNLFRTFVFFKSHLRFTHYDEEVEKRRIFMNFIKRGLKSTLAKKGRTILLIAVFSAILIFVLAGLTIRSAALSATESAKKSIGATVTLSTNRENAFKNQTSDTSSSDADSSASDTDSKPSFTTTPVNLADAKKIAALGNVKSYSFTVSTSANAGDGIEAITTSSSTDSADAAADSNAPGGGKMAQMSSGDFQISGVSSTSSVSTFSAGTAKISSGEGITASDKGTKNVVIESTLAEANDLKVGDTFKITDSDDSSTYEVTIKGIYKTTESTSSGMSSQFSFMDPSNTIYSYYTLANTIKGGDTDTIDSATYTLTDPAKMSAFAKKAKALIDTDTFSIETNDQTYQQMLSPLNNVASFAKNIVILVAVAGVVILTLIVMITIRERRYEIGVLLSLGESRVKLIGQFFFEIIICMIIALGIATVSGNAVGNVVGQQLLDQQTESATATSSSANQGPGGGGGGMQQGGAKGGMSQTTNPFSSSSAIDELNVAVKPAEIAALTGVALLISLIAILISSIGILRMNPKKILIS